MHFDPVPLLFERKERGAENGGRISIHHRVEKSVINRVINRVGCWKRDDKEALFEFGLIIIRYHRIDQRVGKGSPALSTMRNVGVRNVSTIAFTFNAVLLGL